MSPLSATLTSEEIEDETHRLLGRFFMAFARVELSLALRVGSDGTFHEKLEDFLNIAVSLRGDSSTQFSEVMAWYMAADSVRETRNRFAHGRWAFHSHTQSVIHVLGYPPARQEERRYSLLELRAIVTETEMLNAELLKFRDIFV
jgi:hypothetical protein